MQSCNRITPAYAGKRIMTCSYKLCYKDHPRLCGEKPRKFFDELDSEGSPPPMRGKVCPKINTGIPIGITPAYAGKRNFSIVAPSRFWDHPRLCGEKNVFRSWKTHFQGSPPPMRGKEKSEKIVEQNLRITPAYAGKSLKRQ